jgi:alanyl-tRNA synthetase
VLLPETGFYVESGGQVSDTGIIVHAEGNPWEIRVLDMRKPAAGVIVHVGEVVSGEPRVGDLGIAAVDRQRRRDIMRNHTATHLLHASLRAVLGDHARQAGSLVAPDHLRFDFTHPQALTSEEIERIEAGVNRDILGDYSLKIQIKPLQQAISEGATALFGEKYGEIVRNITIGESEIFSNELCGGTHVDETGDIGLFLITSEGSAAAGIRRIVGVTGRAAYELVQERFRSIKQAALLLDASPDEVPLRTKQVLDEVSELRRNVAELRRIQALLGFEDQLNQTDQVNGIPALALNIPDADVDTLRFLTDRFRQRFNTGIVVLGSVTSDGRPIVVAALTDDLVKRGLNAVELVKFLGGFLGGGGGGRPALAQAGGKDASRLDEALAQLKTWIEQKTT